MSERLRGAVKWYNEDKGFGFIIPDGSNGRGSDDFVHASALKAANIAPRQFYDGRRIEYALKPSEKSGRKPCACDIKLLD